MSTTSPMTNESDVVVVVTKSSTDDTVAAKNVTSRGISRTTIMNGNDINHEQYYHHPMTTKSRNIDSDCEIEVDIDDDDDEEEECDECHCCHHPSQRPTTTTTSIASTATTTSKLPPTALLLLLQQQQQPQPQILLRPPNNTNVVLTPPVRRSRRETTIHSTKSSLQLQKQNCCQSHVGVVVTTGTKDKEGEEDERPATNQGEEQDEGMPSPAKKRKDKKVVVATDSTTTPNTKKLVPSSESSVVTDTTSTSATSSENTLSPSLQQQQEENEQPKNQQSQQEKVSSLSSPPPPRRRCSVRNRSTSESLHELASIICSHNNEDPSNSNNNKKNVVFITGAGLSVDSGIRPFRTCSATATSLSSVYHDPHSKNQTKRKKKKKTNHILQAGIWDEVIWTMATRASFRKDPVRWYTQFWNVYFDDRKTYKPNVGHYVMDCLLNEFDNVYQITQNIDGLQSCVESNNTAKRKASCSDNSQPLTSLPKKQLIEVHGRCGLYKCCPPEEDDDNDDDTDDNDDVDNYTSSLSNGDSTCQYRSSASSSHRPVRIGSDKASRRLREKYKIANACPYEYLYSLTVDQVILRDVEVKTNPGRQQQHNQGKGGIGCTDDDDDHHSSTAPPIHNTRYSSQKRKSMTTTTMATTPPDDDVAENVVTIPTCPHCHNIVMPQALLFDESYHDHTYYQYELVEEWIQNASVIVLVGTSCTVQLTTQTLKYALHNSIPIYNMNIHKLPVQPQRSLSSTTATTTTTTNTNMSSKSGNTTTTTQQSNTNSMETTPTGSILNIIGPSSETLQLLLAECRSIQEARNK